MAPHTTTEKEQDHNHHNIVELASENENLSTLVAAIDAAGLVETLEGDGPFTVFAPTNEAFDALPEGTLESLLQPENRELLVEILTYHVVPGKVMSGDLSDGMSAETVQGSEVSISVSDYGVRVDEASVSEADIEASNGVVHVIDSVILPPEDTSSGY
ncbi:fasciclin domain-containing protein [Rhodohalobacter sp. SW132]|nr:fasciclin domain-containing protein [Rhodohalobacter sp. SW132]